ncbi:MAG: hypothetical protein HYZ28_24390 [Myxococcales bacterium]|nr:hypothetical protein [Myxococcales bacterium]
MRHLWASLLALAPAAAAAYCPCYTLSSSYNSYNCGVEAAPGTNPNLTTWQSIFSLVAQGPSVWGTAGPSVADLGEGCNKPQPPHKVPARFPCELLKAIAMQESGWRQFCVPDTPADQVGGASRTIISFDCGYGVGQVTSGMHIGESPGFDRSRVASDATYNLATGTRILASKWSYTNCVGDNQPRIVEHWYSATWAYNGLAYSNNPNNPIYSTSRGVYRPSVGGAAPYQEKVFGRVEYPPSAAHWSSVALAYPDLADIGTGSSPPDLPEPTCAGPTNCATSRSTHVSSCFGVDAGSPDAGKPDAGSSADAGSNADAGQPDAGQAGSDAGGSAPPDAGATADAGSAGAPIPAATPASQLGEAVGGCGCSSTETRTLLLLTLLGLLARKQFSGRRD